MRFKITFGPLEVYKELPRAEDAHKWAMKMMIESGRDEQTGLYGLPYAEIEEDVEVKEDTEQIEKIARWIIEESESPLDEIEYLIRLSKETVLSEFQI